MVAAVRKGASDPRLSLMLCRPTLGYHYRLVVLQSSSGV